MSKPNRVMAYVPKGESAYAVFNQGQRTLAAECADYYRTQGYKVRETRFRVGPRQTYQFNYRVSVYFDSDTQAVPDPMGWKASAA